MSVPYKPHLVTFSSVAEDVGASGIVEMPTYTTLGDVEGLLIQASADEVFKALSVELRNPGKFICEIADVSAVKQGDRASYGARIFQVHGVAIRDAGIAIDHAVVYMEEVESV